MRFFHLWVALGAFATMSIPSAAAAQAPSAPGGSAGEYVAACMRERASEAPNRAALERLCRVSFGRVIRSRAIAQLLINAAPPRLKRDDAATLQRRLAPVKWDAPNEKGMRLAELGDDWYAFMHGQNPVTFFTVMWKGQGAASFALPAALRWLGAKVDPLFCQTKPNGLDRVYWMTPPGKPGLFFQISEGPIDAEGLGDYAAAMNLKDPKRPATPPFTAQERAKGYTFDCPSEF